MAPTVAPVDHLSFPRQQSPAALPAPRELTSEQSLVLSDRDYPPLSKVSSPTNHAPAPIQDDVSQILPITSIILWLQDHMLE